MQAVEASLRDAPWVPHPGPQTLFLTCPVWEVLYEGTRGASKTDALLMDFAQHVGKGFGPAWRGVMFRRNFPELGDVVAKSQRWFPQIFPGASFNRQSYTWTFPDGEALLLRAIRVPDDYWKYHGHEYPWIGWEELTTWPDAECYDRIKACSRSSDPRVPRCYRSTTNPYGPGHQWVKKYFIDVAAPGVVHSETMPDGSVMQRVHIHGTIFDNPSLLRADPGYVGRLMAITDESRRKAWLEGSWDIVTGGAFDGVWDERVHVIDSFEIPAEWHIDRSFDWGSSSPFSVLWWAQSDGSEVTLADGSKKTFPAGSLFTIAEWYGGTDLEEGLRMLNVEIADGINDLEKADEVLGRLDVAPGPADTSIFDIVNGQSIALDMETRGVSWERAIKSAGSRINGFQVMRSRLAASKQFPMEAPGWFLFSRCRRLIAHLPLLQLDERHPEDVDTSQPDHDYDAARYRILEAGAELMQASEIV